MLDTLHDALHRHSWAVFWNPTSRACHTTRDGLPSPTPCPPACSISSSLHRCNARFKRADILRMCRLSTTNVRVCVQRCEGPNRLRFRPSASHSLQLVGLSPASSSCCLSISGKCRVPDCGALNDYFGYNKPHETWSTPMTGPLRGTQSRELAARVSTSRPRRSLSWLGKTSMSL
jgi:hypothetical protein